MSLLPSTHPLGLGLITAARTPNPSKPPLHRLPITNPRSDRRTAPFIPAGQRIPRPRRWILGVCCSNPAEESRRTSPDEEWEGGEFFALRSWDVPWDWKVTLYVMMPYFMSILFSGVVESGGLGGPVQHISENILSQSYTTDEVAIRLFVDQLLKSVVKLSILYIFISPHRPFPDDVLSFRWSKPLSLQNGWILWAGGGLLVASASIFLIKTFMSGSLADQTDNKVESLMQFLPLIGSSNLSTVCLFCILGVFAPVCEEILYRGFLMTSLTKWLPLHVSIIISSVVFTLAHQSPGKTPEIFIFGLVLGLVYSQTRNLLSPIMMHACWNLGVILTLTFLQLQGIEIQKYML